MFAEKPKKDIYHFIGRFTMVRMTSSWRMIAGTCNFFLVQSDGRENMKEDPLSVENTMWANTVLASGVYT